MKNGYLSDKNYDRDVQYAWQRGYEPPPPPAKRVTWWARLCSFFAL